MEHRPGHPVELGEDETLGEPLLDHALGLG